MNLRNQNCWVKWWKFWHQSIVNTYQWIITKSCWFYVNYLLIWQAVWTKSPCSLTWQGEQNFWKLLVIMKYSCDRTFSLVMLAHKPMDHIEVENIFDVNSCVQLYLFNQGLSQCYYLKINSSDWCHSQHHNNGSSSNSSIYFSISFSFLHLLNCLFYWAFGWLYNLALRGRHGPVGLFVNKFTTAPRVGGSNPRRSSFFIEGTLRISLVARQEMENGESRLCQPRENSMALQRRRDGEISRTKRTRTW